MINWVLIGGESGAANGIRLCQLEWIADLFKQLGSNLWWGKGEYPAAEPTERPPRGMAGILARLPDAGGAG